MKRRTFLTGAAALIAAPAHAQQAPERFAAAAAYSAEHAGAALIISRSGIRLGESYAAGASAGAILPLGAATRIFAPVLAACLVADELLNLDEPAAMTFGDWGADPVKNQIPVRMLLNGTSGLIAPAGGQDLASLIALQPETPPGQAFSDDAAPYCLFAEIARRKLQAAGYGGDVGGYLAMRALDEIGCAVRWARDADGGARLDDGAFVSPDGWARLGELVQRGGLWRGRFLLDFSTLRSAEIGSFAEGRRGMGFWLASAGPAQPFAPARSDLWTLGAAAPLDLVMASGAEGQRLYLIASQRLVIARLSNGTPAPDWSDAAFLARVFSDI